MEPPNGPPRLAIEKIPSASTASGSGRRSSARLSVKPLNASDIPYSRRSSPPRTFTYQKEGVLYVRQSSMGHLTPHRVNVLTPKSKAVSTGSPRVKLKEAPLIESSREVKKFNQELLSFLDSEIDKNKPNDLNALEIEKLAKAFTKSFIDALFEGEKRTEKIKAADVVKVEVERAFNAWDHMIRTLDLAEPYINKLAALTESLVKFLNEKGKTTELAKQIYAYFSLQVEEKDLRALVNLLKSDRFDKKVRELCQRIFGKQFHECLSAWESWLNPQSSKLLRSWVTSAYMDSVAAKMLPGTVYLLRHPTCNWKDEINKVTCYEIVRCLFNGFARFDRITFHTNGTSFDLQQNLLEKDGEKAFFARFNQAMARCGFQIDPKEEEKILYFEKFNWKDPVFQKLLINPGENRDLLEAKMKSSFITSDELLKMHLAKKVSQSTAERDFANYFLENIHFYRRLTNSPYSIFHEALKEYLPTIFSRPYGPKLQQGITLDIHVDSYEQYRIVQTRCFGVYLYMNEQTQALDLNRVLAKVWFGLIIDGGKEEEFRFEISKIEIPSTTKDSERWDILKALTDVNAQLA